MHVHQEQSYSPRHMTYTTDDQYTLMIHMIHLIHTDGLYTLMCAHSQYKYMCSLFCESGMLDAAIVPAAAGDFAAGALAAFRLGFRSLLSFLDRLPVGSASALLACRRSHLAQAGVLRRPFSCPHGASSSCDPACLLVKRNCAQPNLDATQVAQ